jgi:hypothetical protein
MDRDHQLDIWRMLLKCIFSRGNNTVISPFDIFGLTDSDEPNMGTSDFSDKSLTHRCFSYIFPIPVCRTRRITMAFHPFILDLLLKTTTDPILALERDSISLLHHEYLE